VKNPIEAINFQLPDWKTTQKKKGPLHKPKTPEPKPKRINLYLKLKPLEPGK